MGVFLLKNDGEHDDDDKNDLEEREEVVLWADDDDAEEVSLEMIVFSISRFNDRVTPWDRLILSLLLFVLEKWCWIQKKQPTEKNFWLLQPRFFRVLNETLNNTKTKKTELWREKEEKRQRRELVNTSEYPRDTITEERAALKAL